jgi:hypothetical protein
MINLASIPDRMYPNRLLHGNGDVCFHLRSIENSPTDRIGELSRARYAARLFRRRAFC